MGHSCSLTGYSTARITKFTFLQRFVDHVVMTIDYHLLHGFVDSLYQVLLEKLGVCAPDAHERCDAYLADSVDVVARREVLRAQKGRLERAYEDLVKFRL